MPEIVAVPAPQVTDVWVVENHEIEYLGLEPQPPVELIVVEQVQVVALVDTGKGDQGPQGPVGQSVIPFARDYQLEVTTGVQPFRFPFAGTLRGISACLGIPATGSSVILDLNVDGASIFANPADRPAIPAGAIDLPEIALNVPFVSGNRLTIDVDDIGSTFAGEDLTVFVRYEQAV
jgi:hypothetical protein